MKNWSKQAKIIVAILAFFILVQAFQPAKNQDIAIGPKDLGHTVLVPANVLSVLKKSCYDCHSNNTSYPWYDHITPVNWWVANHINEGKRELNFTVFGDYAPRKQARKLEEIAETIEEEEMPLKSYLIMHGDASLSPEQRQLVSDWARSAQAALSPAATAE